MKKLYLSILALCGLAANDDGKPDFEPTEEQFNAIKSQLEKGNKAISDLAATNSTITSLETAKKTAEDALAAKNTEIEALKSEKNKAVADLADANDKLSKLESEVTEPKTARQDTSSTNTEKKFEDYSHNKKLLKEIGEV